MNAMDSTSLIAAQGRQLRLQRIAILLLLASLTVSLMYGRSEKRRADRAQEATPPVLSQAIPAAASAPAASYYSVTLVGEDGSRKALKGKSLELDLGNDRLLDVNLARRPGDQIMMWAFAQREDEYFHALVFHPYCSNVFCLELERHSKKSVPEDMAGIVSYQEP